MADGQSEVLLLPLGSTVSDALKSSDFEVGENDEVSPPRYTLITSGMEIQIKRVVEYFETVSAILPFERQIVKNESISEGETRLIQAGKNGLEEITYRIVEREDSEQIRVPVQRSVILQPIPEILMIGAQRGYTPLTFPGKIAFVSAQNAWIIDGETGFRKPVVSTGDLDGRVLELSPDGNLLLFTRQTEDLKDGINSLWLIDTRNPDAEPMDLGVENIIHFAEWSPQSPSERQTYTLAYSTVEPRPSAPGWQANNDLQLLRITESGVIYEEETLLETNSGGQYGWWGTKFLWSPDGKKFAYSRADSIGRVDLEDGVLVPLVEITPYQTLSDWAWTPPIGWSSNSEILYYVEHGEPIALENPEASQAFNVMAFSSENGTMGPLKRKSGMFSHLAPSPALETYTGESAYSLAYLQSMQPLESEASGYRLIVMDRDGSNPLTLFPPEGEVGLEPGPILWAPDGSRIALLYRNNLWIIDPSNLITQPLTSEGQTIAFDWSQ